MLSLLGGPNVPGVPQPASKGPTEAQIHLRGSETESVADGEHFPLLGYGILERLHLYLGIGEFHLCSRNSKKRY